MIFAQMLARFIRGLEYTDQILDRIKQLLEHMSSLALGQLLLRHYQVEKLTLLCNLRDMEACLFFSKCFFHEYDVFVAKAHQIQLCRYVDVLGTIIETCGEGVYLHGKTFSCRFFHAQEHLPEVTLPELLQESILL